MSQSGLGVGKLYNILTVGEQIVQYSQFAYKSLCMLRARAYHIFFTYHITSHTMTPLKARNAIQ